MASNGLGDLEQVVLLAVLRLGEDAHAMRIREELAQEAGRPLSRGALYRTLERLVEKGRLEWSVGESSPERGGLPRRHFALTAEGIDALSAARRTLLHMWEGVEHVLK